MDKVLEFITKFCFEDVRLWFNVNVERQEEGFRKLADAHADSVLQCPVDFLAPLDIPVPVDARVILGKTKL